jgi:di/tricarboxylate transporter
MTLSQWILIATIFIPMALVIANRLRVDIAALIMAAVIGIGQFSGLPLVGGAGDRASTVKAISGLGQPVIFTLVSLFIVSRCLDKTGVTRWISRQIMAVGGASTNYLIGLCAASTAFLSLFMSNLAAAALILPSAMHISRKTGIKPSKLLIPVAFGSLLGGSATFFTTANIIASDLLIAARPAQHPLKVLDFTPTGGLIAISGLLFMTLVASRMLPDRVPSQEQMVARRTGSDLEDLYQLGERLWEAKVLRGSKIAGKTLKQSEIGEQFGLTIIAIWHQRQAVFAPLPEQRISEGDILLIIGRSERVSQLVGMGLQVGREDADRHISTAGVRFVEAALAPHSAYVGQTLKRIGFRRQYGFTAVALLRGRSSFRTDVADISLQAGDSLLMIGERGRISHLESDPDLIVLESDLSDQPVEWRQAAQAIVILIAAIVASIAGVPVYLSMLVAALAVLLLRIVTPEEAFRSVEWPAIFLIAGMVAVSLAMVNTGLAALIGEFVVHLATPFGPLGLAGGAYLLAALLTQIIGGQVAMLVIGPILISAAIGLGTSPQAVAVAAAIGCSASFLTPMAHPVNVLMIAPANYRFQDFTRIGWVLTLISFVMLLIGLKLFWNL